MLPNTEANVSKYTHTSTLAVDLNCYDRWWLLVKALTTGLWNRRWVSSRKFFLFFPPFVFLGLCFLPGLKRQVEGYCPVGAAAVGARNICSCLCFSLVFPQKETTFSSRKLVEAGIKHLNSSEKQEKSPYNKFSAVISWFKSSGLVGVVQSRVRVKLAEEWQTASGYYFHNKTIRA